MKSLMASWCTSCFDKDFVYFSLTVRCPASEGDGLTWSGYSTFNVEGVDIVVILEQESCMEASGQEVRNLIRKVDAELGRGGM